MKSKRLYSLPIESTPLEDGTKVKIINDIEHAFFLRCWEIYRIITLAQKRKEDMIHFFSMFRDHKQFEDVFSFRKLNFDEFTSSKFDPELNTQTMILFDMLNELRLYLSYTDHLPIAVQNELEQSLFSLKRSWSVLGKLVNQKYGWKFKEL